jgi:hypothetical protein
MVCDQECQSMVGIWSFMSLCGRRDRSFQACLIYPPDHCASRLATLGIWTGGSVEILSPPPSSLQAHGICSHS